ncbi:CDF family Co(II)/Ni(II) efflux transporter DmeF [Luteimonas panaciterrae]|uniref:CDF family Co(II)/Ni(II) efflux transporter DmeF n=1 Tax=Luteimonas panaciterrae TaxID=363885 RepID=UPI001CFAA9AD|nr:CDF family Co(II)/Ni(II) efflux transporter DmeF [Luteimonas panaciterrae]
MSHLDALHEFTHRHDYLGDRHERNARRTWYVVALTAGMMVFEILAGWWTGSMALLADGFHMATHAGALAIAGFAYWYARAHRDDRRFSFGTGKIGDLAGFSSALILAVIALGIGIESVLRLMNPVTIAFDQAIVVAILGLVVNLVSAWLLSGDHHHHHGHAHGHEHDHHDHHHGHDHDDHHHHEHAGHAHSHADHNLRSAYFHVLADALTSVLAVVALLLGRTLGWVWMDALMGVIGALVILRWSYGLLRDTSAVLLDASAPAGMEDAIRKRLEFDDHRIADLHLWRVGPGSFAAIVSLVTHHPQPLADYRARLEGVESLAHVSIEVQTCG